VFEWNICIAVFEWNTCTFFRAHNTATVSMQGMLRAATPVPKLCIVDLDKTLWSCFDAADTLPPYRRVSAVLSMSIYLFISATCVCKHSCMHLD